MKFRLFKELLQTNTKMKKITILTIFLALYGFTYCQTESNLSKYWFYRQRLKDKFILLSPNNEQGTNIPAITIDGNTLRWDDGNSSFSHYLGILATEYRLLKNNDKNYTQTLRELKWALKAFDRLDETAEYHYGSSNNLNGFFLRDDVDLSFFDKYKKGGSQEHFNTSDFYSQFNNENLKEMSQDNVWHLLEGLSLVKTLVDIENVDNETIDFPLWVQNIVYRVIRIMQHENQRYIKKYYLVIFWEKIYYSWYIENPVTGNLVSQGSGVDLDNELWLSGGFAEAGNWITDYGKSQFPNLHYGLSNLIAIGNFRTIFENRNGDFSVTLGLFTYTYHTSKDWYSVNSLSTIAGNIISNSYDELIYKRNNPIYYGPYDHSPLLYLVLHGKDNPNLNIKGSALYNSEKNYYLDLLNNAPRCGPYKILDNNENLIYGSVDWSSSSRLVWPENLGENKDLGEYAGLDYMLLYNLYHLTYEDDFRAVEDSYKLINLNTNPLNPYNKYAYKIISSSYIDHPAVNFSATKEINLIPGFEVKPGSNFTASIVPNSSITYQPFTYETKTPYICTTCIPQGSGSAPQQSKKQEKAKITEKTKENSIEGIAINIFPNPATITITFQYSGDVSQILSIEILNPTGTLMLKKTNGFSNQQQFNVEHFSPGVYCVRLVTNSKAISKVFIKS